MFPSPTEYPIMDNMNCTLLSQAARSGTSSVELPIPCRVFRGASSVPLSLKELVSFQICMSPVLKTMLYYFKLQNILLASCSTSWIRATPPCLHPSTQDSHLIALPTPSEVDRPLSTPPHALLAGVELHPPAYI